MVNFSFSDMFPNNKGNSKVNRGNGGNNNGNNNGNNDNNLNEGERGASPLSLPATPAIPIAERKYSEEEEAVLTKFIEYILIKNSNSKPIFQPIEKAILSSIYYLRPTQDKLQQRFRRMGIIKEGANLEKNYKNALKRVATYRSRRRNRKTRKV